MNSSILEKSVYREAVRKLNYHYIRTHAELACDTIDYYIVVRSLLVLGHYQEAQKWLDHFEAKLSHDPFLLPFLQIQFAVFQQRELHQKSCVDLSRLAGSIPDDPYWLGEYHFMLGYLHNQLDEYRQGTRHHHLSSEYYHACAAIGPESIALFNLCVSHNHLNERALFEQAFQRLEDLAKYHPCPTIQHPYLRMQAYRMVDMEEYGPATRTLKKLLSILESQDRLRDIGTTACLLGYTYLQMNHTEEFEKLLARTERYASDLTHLHRSVIQELVLLNKTGLLYSQAVSKLLRRWNRLEIESTHKLFFLSTLLDRLSRGGDYDLMIRVARQANHISLKSEMALSQVDCRYYEVLGLIKTGQLTKANRILNMYKCDAKEVHSSPKLAKAVQLEKELQLAKENLACPVASSVEGHYLEIDIAQCRAIFDGHHVSLNRVPLIQRLLVVLIHSGKLLPTERVFSQVYKMEFNPLLHENRFKSLVERTRQLLGASDCIVRCQGQIGLSPNIKAKVVADNILFYSVQKRRHDLMAAILQARNPVSISQLEAQFSCTRRTLQLDLQHLTSRNLITTTGGTRNRRYLTERHR